MKISIRTVFLALFLTCISGRCNGEEVLFEESFIPVPILIPVPVKFANTTALLILDTGSSYDILESSLLPRLPKSNTAKAVRSFGAEPESNVFDLAPVSMGKWKLPPSKAITFDFTEIRRTSGIELRGILGVDVLQQIAVDIDWDKRRIRFIKNLRPRSEASLYTPGKRTRAQMYLPLTFVPEEDAPTLQLSIDGLPVNAILDTGSTHSIGIRHETFERLVAKGTIVRESAANSRSSITLGGPVKFEEGHFTRGDLLGVDLKGCKVTDSLDGDNLGMFFLANFNFTLDIPGRRFYFTGRKLTLPISPYHILGLHFRYDDGHCYVTDVDSESGAKTADIRLGDMVLELEALKKRDLNVLSVYELCETHAGETIDVEIAHSGDQKSIKTRLTLRANP